MSRPPVGLSRSSTSTSASKPQLIGGLESSCWCNRLPPHSEEHQRRQFTSASGVGYVGAQFQPAQPIILAAETGSNGRFLSYIRSRRVWTSQSLHKNGWLVCLHSCWLPNPGCRPISISPGNGVIRGGLLIHHRIECTASTPSGCCQRRRAVVLTRQVDAGMARGTYRRT